MSAKNGRVSAGEKNINSNINSNSASLEFDDSNSTQMSPTKTNMNQFTNHKLNLYNSNMEIKYFSSGPYLSNRLKGVKAKVASGQGMAQTHASSFDFKDQISTQTTNSHDKSNMNMTQARAMHGFSQLDDEIPEFYRPKKIKKGKNKKKDSHDLYVSRGRIQKHTSGLGNNSVKYDPFQIKELLQKQNQALQDQLSYNASLERVDLTDHSVNDLNMSIYTTSKHGRSGQNSEAAQSKQNIAFQTQTQIQQTQPGDQQMKTFDAITPNQCGKLNKLEFQNNRDDSRSSVKFENMNKVRQSIKSLSPTMYTSTSDGKERSYRGSVLIIDQYQGQSPSHKFQASLNERESIQQFQQTWSRVKQLEINNDLAQKHLRKTLDTLDKSEQIQQRKHKDLTEKYEWLNMQNDKLLNTRAKNNRLKEERHQNIFNRRQMVLNQNIRHREQTQQIKMKQGYQHTQEIQALNKMRDRSVANVYFGKKMAKEREMMNYTAKLIQTKKSCDKQAFQSLHMTEQYQERIKELEQREGRLLDSLQKTKNQANYLVNDLSKKSVSLANTLVPRNPIKPKRSPHFQRYSPTASLSHNSSKNYDFILSSRIQEAQQRQQEIQI